MPKSKTETKVDRRGFLKGIGTGAAGAATIAAATSAPAVAAESAADKKKKNP